MKIGIVGGIFRPRTEDRSWLAPESVLANGLEAVGIEVHRIPHRGTLPPLNLDVIHVHHLGWALLAALGAPGSAAVVLTPHDGRLISGAGAGPGRRALARIGARRTDVVVVLGEAERATWSTLGVPPDRMRVIPNGIPLHPFADVSPIDADREGLLFVGQLVPVKGVHDLILAFAHVGRTRRAKLRLVYQHGPLERDVREMALRCGIGGQVDFLGYRTPGELAALYRSTEAVVLPSHAEVLPSVLTEAMLGGARIVATRVGCVGEQVGPNGALVQPGDIAGLARAIEAALEKPWQQGEALTRHAWAKARYSVRVMVDGHVRLYAELTDGRLAPRSRSRLERDAWRLATRARRATTGTD